MVAPKWLDEKLRAVYYNVNEPGRFGSISNIHRNLKNKNVKISKSQIREWLENQDVYTLHKYAKYNIKRNHYNITNIGDLYEIDLIDMSKDKKFNDGYGYILTCIDVFSKYAWVRPVKTKTGIEITKAFKSILDSSGIIPKAVQSDKGREFKNHIFKDFLNNKGVVQQFPHVLSNQKAAVIERFNRTLKEKMFKFYTYTKRDKKRFVDIIHLFVESYNNTYHSTIRMKPIEVNKDNVLQVYKNTRAKNVNEKMQVLKYNVDDYVRIVRKKSKLEHGYTQTYTREVFKIDCVIKKKPYPLYRLKDLKGNNIEGKFYADELQKVGTPIKIIKTRGLGDTLQYYIETADGTYNWISAKELQ